MGYSLFNKQKLNISFRSNYRCAYFGFFHVAFMDNDGRIVLCEEDRESVKSCLNIYYSKISAQDTYPIFDGNSFKECDSLSQDVLKQVLGFPDVLVQTIDLTKELLPQLNFVPGLKNLKKECYILKYKELQRKWFSDDFKLYCLNNGFFFMHDETKPFIERKDYSLPIFINFSNMPEKYKKLCEESDSKRIVIDFLNGNVDKTFLLILRKLDNYSFERKINYFINGNKDEELSILINDPSLERKYSYCLRQYFASIINALYDDYCFEELNKVTAKLSFLTKSKLHLERDIFSVSSFNADMFSFDNENFSFAVQDRELIHDMLVNAIESDPGADLLMIYSHCGLPYYGFKYLNDLDDFTADSIISNLPFCDEISSSEYYLSCKRSDNYYSYLSEEKEHRFVFLKRQLLKDGIDYSSNKPLLTVMDKENQIFIRIDDRLRQGLLYEIFDKSVSSFFELIYPAYVMDRKIAVDETLEYTLRHIDEASHFEALHYFFHAFRGYSLSHVVDLMLITFNLQECKTESLIDFLAFAFMYPFLIVEEEYRRFCTQNGDALSLAALDGLNTLQISYEPNMPLPYVSFGKLVYSFKSGYFSKPYICECQKEAIDAKIEFYKSIYIHKNNKFDIVSFNNYVLPLLGLPEDVIDDIQIGKDLLSQLPFKKHICHRCLNTYPSVHECIDDNDEDQHNVFLTYIRSQASKCGVFFDEPITLNYDMSVFFDSLTNQKYHSLLNFDRSKIQPILLPYINVSKKMIVALISSFFPNDMSYADFYEEVVSFIDLDELTIQKLMFDCSPNDYSLIYSHMMVFTRLVYLYKMVEIAYAFHVSDSITPKAENEICMNVDYIPYLEHPYVILGQTYNAYADSLEDGHYYFCECDKPAMYDFASRFSALYDERKMRKDIKAPILLGLLGLPYLVTLKYSEFEDDNIVDGLFSRMEFKEGICRRENHLNHSAYDEPFRKAFPNKEDMISCYDFAINGMAHDRFKIISDLPLSDIRFSGKHFYDLNAYEDSYLPYFDFCSKSIPESLFTFFVMSKEDLYLSINEYLGRNKDNSEAMAYASGVVMDTYEKDDKCILNFIFDMTSAQTLKEEIMKFFPVVERIRPSYMELTMKAILGFVTFLIEKLIEKYALMEERVGK